MPVQKKGGLGKGLGALFSEQNRSAPQEPVKEVRPEPVSTDGSAVISIDINDITPNRSQPRRDFDEEALEELAESIRAHGLIQPIIVRKIEDGYEIVAGERRWRASRLAGLRKVPCILREYTEKENMMVALIENLQREDLNPIEEADAFARLAEEYQMTHEAIAESLGQMGTRKSRSYVTNTLRLRELPEKVRNMIARKELSAGHGRALLSLPSEAERIKAAEIVLRDGLNVRQTEELVKGPLEKKPTPSGGERSVPQVSYQSVESDLKEILGAKVRIREKNDRGSIQLSFFSKDELERLVDLLKTLKGDSL